MTPTPDTRPPQGAKDPETGLFCWRYGTGQYRYVKWLTLEEYSARQEKHNSQERKYQARKRAKKKALKVDRKLSKTVASAKEKRVLELHQKGKSLFYISTLLNMRASLIQQILATAA